MTLSINDAQYKDTQHNGLKCDTQQNNIQHNSNKKRHHHDT
jgi:hypothetical protein